MNKIQIGPTLDHLAAAPNDIMYLVNVNTAWFTKPVEVTITKVTDSRIYFEGSEYDFINKGDLNKQLFYNMEAAKSFALGPLLEERRKIETLILEIDMM